MRTLVLRCAVLLFVAAAAEAEQSIICESMNRQYRECRIGTNGTIRMVSEIGDRHCFEGLTWGVASPGVVWVNYDCRARFSIDSDDAGKRVICESQKGDRVLCHAETDSGVTLAQQLSKAACVKGQTWDFDEDRDEVWVDRGCRGQFILGGTTKPPRPQLTFDAVIPCESENGRRKNCSADTSAGVQLVRQLDDASCAFGKEWGYDAKGIWVTKGCRAEFAVGGKPKAMARAVTCVSSGPRKECEADTQFGVALARQLGGSACVLDQSWGFDEKGVWVSEGCHAQFALGGFRLPASAVPASAARVMCESLDGKRAQCPVDTARGVGLVNQTSSVDCVLNRNWGYGPAGIWVDGGCGAEFAVAR
ncbi:MAG TPA: DUF3011 domain-containing protein [Thermoanaerobaculia bacterium]|nr:DUF3011 domain-containing protein [Thermoanaerobaculia bacterium]